MEAKLTSISGTVVDYPLAKSSKAGKEYVELLIKDAKAAVWKCMFFQNCIAALDIALDAKITVLGKCEGATVFVNSWTSGVPSKQREVKATGYETPERAKATYKANCAQRKADGWVWVAREKAWRKSYECVCIGTEYMTEIDFVMLKLGEERINREAREWLGTSSPQKLLGSVYSLDVKGWQELKGRWLTEAQEGF